MFTGVIFAGDFVEDGLEAEVVEGFNFFEAFGGAVGVKFGNEEIVDAVAGRAGDNFVGGLLVGPGGAEASGVDDFEDGVYAEEIVGVDRGAAAGGVQRKFVGIKVAAVDGVGVDVDGLVESEYSAFDGALGAGGGELAIVAGFVVDAGGERRAAGDDREDAGEGIGGLGGGGVEIGDASAFELSERGRNTVLTERVGCTSISRLYGARIRRCRGLMKRIASRCECMRCCLNAG